MTDPNGGAPPEALAAALCEHPAVAAAEVTAGEAGRALVARLVPDPVHAAMLSASAEVEAAGRLGPLGWHEPAGDLRVAGLNRTESDFLYREIFEDNAYFRNGIALPPGAVVVDVGANIGMFTLCAARHSPGVRVVAVEPVAELAEAMAINAELHGVDVTVLNVGVGRGEAEADFTFYPNNSVMSGGFADADEDLAVLRGYLLAGDGAEGGAQLDRLAAGRLAAERRRVPVTTLSLIAAEQGLSRIDLLKIDVEKAEEEVLGGIDAGLWARIDRIVVEVHDVGGRLASVLATLRAHGFAVTDEKDPRLAGTPCVNVFAHRPGRTAVPGPRSASAPPGRGPALRRLESELRDLLAERFPESAAPRSFTVVAALDGTGTGTGTGVPDVRQGGPIASTERTEVLADIWSGLFGADAVRPDADFFELGGDSLTAVRLLARLEERLGEDALAPDAIFTESTFGALAAAVDASAPPAATGNGLG
ncbi:FkbM family methyltransferase [Actinomadura sp. GTD37]|uniref:FkbM family methyltransferase n=1 Tax=Actinomadura sp. GTD37 TaxID=1778030 RepID=UPI0035BEF2EC